MGTDSISLSVICIVLAMLAGFVVLPAFRSWRAARVPLLGEWTRLLGEMTALTRAGAYAGGFSEPTTRALAMVLGDHPGIGRRASVPQALEVLEDAINAVSRALGSLSAQAILIGLLGTVSVFARVFPELARQPGQAEILQHMGPIYTINAAAVLTALLLLIYRHRVRQQGDLTVQEAARALDRLQDSFADEVDPHLAALLARIAEDLERRSASLHDRQIGRVEELVREVRTLATGMQEVVQHLAAQATGGPEQILGPIRQVQATVEQLAESLNRGLETLAQPFLQVAPAMAAMEAGAASLERASTRDGAAVTELQRAATAMGESAGLLKAAVADLPERIDAGMHSFSAAASAAVGEGVSTGMSAAMATVPERIVTGVVNGLQGDLQKLQTTVNTLSQTAAGFVALPDVVLRLDQAVAALPGSIRRGLEEFAASASRAVSDGASTALSAAMKGLPAEIAAGVVAGLRVELQQLRSAAEELSGAAKGIEGLPDGFRSLGEALASAVDRLSAALQASMASAAAGVSGDVRAGLQGMSENLPEAIAKAVVPELSRDLREAVASLQGMREACQRLEALTRQMTTALESADRSLSDLKDRSGLFGGFRSFFGQREPR